MSVVSLGTVTGDESHHVTDNYDCQIVAVVIVLQSDLLRVWYHSEREVGGWGRDPKKCTGRDWGMGSSTI